MVRLGLAAIVAAGSLLRLWSAGDSVIFGDEVHALGIALDYDVNWFASEFRELPALMSVAFRTYLPQALYNDFLMATFGLDELTMRLPSLAAGCLSVVLTGYLALRLPAPQACLLTGMVAFSPYLVYLSRSARPFSLVVLLFGVAAWQVFAWLGTKRPRALAGAALAGAFTVFLHPTSIPSVLSLAALPVVVSASRGDLRDRLPDLAKAALVFLAALLVLIGPALGENVADRGGIHFDASIDPALLRAALALAIGESAPAVAWVSLAAALLGSVRLFFMYPVATAWGVATILLQVGAVVAFRPDLFTAWMLLRYCAHLLPLFYLLVAAGLTPPAALAHPRRWHLAAAVGLVSVLALYHGCERHYALGRDQATNVHPTLQFVPRRLPDSFAAEIVPPFYTTLLATLEDGPLLEAPLIPTFPLYDLYQRVHGREVYVVALPPGSGAARKGAGAGEGGATRSEPGDRHARSPARAAWISPPVQRLVRTRPGVRFRRAFFLEDLDLEAAPARYLIVHKRLWKEIPPAFSYLRELPATSGQMLGFGQIQHPLILRAMYGGLGVPRAGPLASSRIYDDRFVSVYDLSAAARRGHGAGSAR